jgi:hypothetical protein
MKTKIYVFEENSITFVLDKANKVMVNATEMANIFGKHPRDFLILENTKAFISEALRSKNPPFLNAEKEEDLVISCQKSGTFMHRVLALKFAAWLSPDLEVWVYSIINNPLFEKRAEREESLKRTAVLQNEQNLLAGRPDKTGTDADRLLAIGYELRNERAIQMILAWESISETADLFEDHEI